MPHLLDVYACPRTHRSRTRRVRDAFLRGYARSHPGFLHTEVDLARDHEKLPTFDAWDVEAKFQVAYGDGLLDEALAKRWTALSELTDQLHVADLVVVSAPMWNFSIPWMLKRWIDCVVQAGLTFEHKDGQYRGLLAGRRAVILVSRDGAYAPGTPFAAFDYQVPYLKQVLGFIGLGPIDVVAAEPLALAGPERAAEALETAMIEAEKLGASL